MTSEHQTDVGLRAAWTHVRLAGHALVAPAAARAAVRWPRVPALGWATRTYLLANAVLYGAWAVLFFEALGHPLGHNADPLVSSTVGVVLWAAGAGTVCAAQLAALLIPGWRVWQICAVVTASWASAFGALLLFDTLRTHGNVIGVLFWWWVVTVHLIFIRHRLIHGLDTASVSGPSLPAPPHPSGADLPAPPGAREEADLIERLHRAVECARRSPQPGWAHL